MAAELDAALVLAGAGFAEGIPGAIRQGARSVVTNPHLYRARLYCRDLHAALTSLHRSESVADRDRALDCCRRVRGALLEIDRNAAIPFRCLDPSCSLLGTPRTTCWLGVLERALAAPPGLETSQERAVAALTGESDQGKAPSGRSASGRPFSRAGAASDPQVVRQGIGFLALVSAYLLFFHIDVQLQILTLPSLFP
jgi:hypothetical protein